MSNSETIRIQARTLCRQLLYVCLGLLAINTLTAFNFVAVRQPKLPVSKENPRIVFVWDKSTPASITEKDLYKDGEFSNSTDIEIFSDIMTESMNVWNREPGSYLDMAWRAYTTASETATKDSGAPEFSKPGMDSEDAVFAITVKSNTNKSSAAFAIPYSTSSEENPDGKTITDCDIQISDGSLRASELLITLTHELGHCVGLGHNHANYGSLMGYSRLSQSAILGLDDIAGLIYLYPSDASQTHSGEMIGLNCGVISARYIESKSTEPDQLPSFPFLCLLLAPILLSLRTGFAPSSCAV